MAEKYKKYWEVYEEEFESQGGDKKTKTPSKAVLLDTTDVITVDDAAEDSGGKKRDEKESEEEGAAPNALFWKSIHKTSSGGVSAAEKIPSQVLFQRRHELEAASLFSRRPASAASSPSPPAAVVAPVVPVAAGGAAPAAESGGVSHHPSWTAGEESQLFQRRSSLKIDFPSLAATGGPGTTAAAPAAATTTPQRARAEGGPEKAPSASFWGPLRGKAKPTTNSPATTASEATPPWGPNRFLNPSSPADAAVPVQPLRQPLPAASVKLPPLVITAPPNSRVKGVPLLLAKAMREAVVVTSAAGAAATNGAASLETTNLSSSISASGSDIQRELRGTSQPGGGRSDRQPERDKSSQRGERSGSQPTKRSGSRRRDDSSERRKRSRRTRTRSRSVSLRF